MIYVIGLFSLALFLDCLLLILLVLIQLPKKEAGAGLAFGGATTDALFGAGTGNVLTKTTKYATITFFVLLLIIGIMQPRVFKRDASSFKEAVAEKSKEVSRTAPVTPAATPAPNTPAANAALSTISNLQSLNLTNATPVVTNAVPK